MTTKKNISHYSIKSKNIKLFHDIFTEEDQVKFEIMLNNTGFFELRKEWIKEILEGVTFSAKKQAYLNFRFSQIENKKDLVFDVIGESNEENKLEYWNYLEKLCNLA